MESKENQILEQMKVLAAEIVKAKYANEASGSLKAKYAKLQSQHRKLYFSRINKSNI